jgi:hypothetical protein
VPSTPATSIGSSVLYSPAARPSLPIGQPGGPPRYIYSPPRIIRQPFSLVYKEERSLVAKGGVISCVAASQRLSRHLLARRRPILWA